MDKQQTKHTPRKYFRCEYVDHLITKFPKPPKDKYKRQKKVCSNERGNCALEEESENDDDNTKKIYMHLWNKCLVMTKVLVEISVTVRNRPIGL